MTKLSCVRLSGSTQAKIVTEAPPAIEPAATNESLGSILFSFGLVLFAFAVLRGPLIWWQLDGRGIVPSGTYLSVIAGVFTLGGILLERARKSGRRFSFTGIGGGLVLVFCSDWLCHHYSLFQAPSIRGEIFVAAALSAFLLYYEQLSLFLFWPLISGVVLFANFLGEANGRVIFSDDHASVFYRLTLLADHFPHIPMYNPLWNAGYDQRDFFSTGILNLYLLSSWLLKIFSVEALYNILIGLTLFGILPLCCYAAIRIFGRERLPACCAAVLSLSATLPWYRWALKYGTMGFITSAALVPLNLALALRLTDEDESIRLPDALLFCATFSLMLLWSPTGLVFLPFFAVAALRARMIFKKRGMKRLIAGLVAINIPWMLVWLNVADVYRFLATPAPSATEQHEAAELQASRDDAGDAAEAAAAEKTKNHDLRKGKGQSKELTAAMVMQSVRNFAVNSNPIILFFGIPGILLFSRRRERAIVFLTALWLFSMGAVLAPLKPQLELDRMLVVFAIVLSLPAGMAISGLLTSASGRNRPVLTRLTGSLAAGFLLVGTAAASGVVRNRSLEVYYFTDDSVKSIVQNIRSFGGSGRVLFSGFVLHELDHGHLAPLAYYSGHPIVASSPVHNTWWYTDIIPEAYRDAGPPEVERYLDYLNVTAVMAHEPFWRDYFASQPWMYRYAGESGRFKMFERLAPHPSYFLEGSGEILSQTTDGVSFRLSTSDAVIKFKYYSFLEITGTTAPCAIEPRHLPGQLDLIQLRGCPVDTPISIKAKTGFRRVFS